MKTRRPTAQKATAGRHFPTFLGCDTGDGWATNCSMDRQGSPMIEGTLMRYNADQGAYVLSDVLGRRGYTIVRRADAGTSEYVYYRDRDGRIRRAIVSPGDDRLRFSNVPGSLLTEVLSRLY